MKKGSIPTLYVKADSVPEAFWKAFKAVHEEGYQLRTQYDRKNPDGSFLDPPGKDARVLVEISNPFAQPRFPVSSFCERGKYIAEILGAKDHLVVPYKELLEKVRAGGEFEATQWPYCYHQRLTAYPASDGSVIDQLEVILGKIARDPITRRAVAITGVPEIDLFMKEDQPCLREIQLRAIENEEGQLALNMFTRWRSRDLFKAWCDNVIGITNLQARLAYRLGEKMGREVAVGTYSDESGSLHIYGQDYTEKGADKFLASFPTSEDFVKRAWTSEKAAELQIIPDLEALREESIWRFPPEAIELINNIIEGYKSGRFVP